MNPYFVAGYWSGAFFNAAAIVLATTYHGPAAGMLVGLTLSALSLYIAGGKK